MVRPSTFHAPGLDHKTDAVIRQILRRWASTDSDKTKPKKKSK